MWRGRSQSFGNELAVAIHGLRARYGWPATLAIAVARCIPVPQRCSPRLPPLHLQVASVTHEILALCASPTAVLSDGEAAKLLAAVGLPETHCHVPDTI